MHLNKIITNPSPTNTNRWQNFSPSIYDANRINKISNNNHNVQNESIKIALKELAELQFSPHDIMYLKSIGIKTPFKSGKEAVDFIKEENIKITYDKTSEEGVHAQYDFNKNLIVINELYKDTNKLEVILAIAEAILHEAGHAKDKDEYSSIQEELDFLGMNAIAHRAFTRKYGDIFMEAKEPIIKDGVSIYAKLFTSDNL